MTSCALQLEEGGMAMNAIQEGDVEESIVSGKSSTGVDASSSGDKAPEIASKETKLVNYSKILVVVVIVVMAIAIGLTTYQYVSSQEDADYKKQFDNVARDIIASSKIRAESIFGNLEGVSVSLTAYALATGAQWPFVVFPHFQVIGMVSNAITGVSTLAISPIVMDEQRPAWENFTMENSMAWLAEGHAYDDEVHPDLYVEQRFTDQPKADMGFPLRPWNETGTVPFIFEFSPPPNFGPLPRGQAPYYIPSWQQAPAPDFPSLTNFDTNQNPKSALFNLGAINYQKPVLSTVINTDYLKYNFDRRFENEEETIPHSYVYYPVFDTLKKDRKVVALMNAFVPWNKFLSNVLPEGEKPITVVLDGNCQESFTFELRGDKGYFIGKGDLHDTQYDSLVKTSEFAEQGKLNEVNGTSCEYSMRVFPTKEWSEDYFTAAPYTYAAAVVFCFVVTTLVFIIYDFLVQRRQSKIMDSATKTQKIVSSLFPSNVRDRLMEEMQPADGKKKSSSWPKASEVAKMAPSSGGDTSGGGKTPSLNCLTSERIFGSQPIADLFPNTTIMFCDMVGFTAWSSVREPTQVFMLLETVYHAFDLIAKRRRVFKVETIGDCYVACAGLPVPRTDHAIVVARFANDCLKKMNELTFELESIFGPDTSQLCMRCGLHSGPVTAGVLRGEKGRFQLFGDTMNTASRMESTGVPRKIHISQETADLLAAGGKAKWVTPREDKVHAKGKGELQTYFLKISAESHGSVTETMSVAASLKDEEYNIETYSKQELSNRLRLLTAITPAEDVTVRNKRLITWNAELLGKLLRQVMARRATRLRKPMLSIGSELVASQPAPSKPMPTVRSANNLLDEVVDVLSLPTFDATLFKNHVDPDTVDLPPKVMLQLTEFVTRIASRYNNKTSFHDFQHASHVTLSVTKLLGRIVNPIELSRSKGPEHKFASALHDHTFGITSDPLTHFAAVFSALIHDLDHPGVPNAVLVKESDPMALRYRGKSVAEQNSVDLAWDILMESQFEDLRGCIYADEDELRRFRSVVVNLVLATDIMDKQLGQLRKDRWAKAFSADTVDGTGESSSNKPFKSEERVPDGNDHDQNRKATVVLEYLIQASDVAHTMQHWHIYLKWNERLFCEMYRMFLDGRSDRDPSQGWYEGEIGFFDHYIIPLAKKLETCGVFGVSSSEYLGYAEANKKEWVEKGEQLVKVYLERFKLREQGLEGSGNGLEGSEANHEDGASGLPVDDPEVIMPSKDAGACFLSNVCEV